MIELEHSPLGGSAAHRFMTCAGSFLTQRSQIEKGEFEDIPTEYAERGSGAHELGAKAIESCREPYEFLGEEFNGYIAGWPGGIELDAIHIYFNECMGILNRHKGTEQGTMLLETTLHHPEVHPLLRGTVDFGYWSQKSGLWLRDYKNGEGVGVAAPNNKQLLYYAFLMLLEFPWMKAGPRDFPMNLGIVQPNFYGIYEEPDVWETTLGVVSDWGHDELLPRMNTLMGRHIPEIIEDDFVPGDHCQFCPVLMDCPKMQRAFQDYADASEDFIAMLTDKELDHYYSQREYARRFMTALEKTVRARLIGGGDIPSAKLVEPKKARVWKPGASAALEAAFGAQAYKAKEIKSPAQIEKLSSRGKDMALEWGYKPDSDMLTIAPLSDPRPPAKPRTNASVFEAHARSPEAAGF